MRVLLLKTFKLLLALLGGQVLVLLDRINLPEQRIHKALCQILLMKRLRRLFLGDVFWYLRILKQHNAADKLIVIAETVCHPLELFNFPNRALQSTI